MKMKRYFAADTRTALRELRDDQGPDAVILSNRRVNGGVEIIAAMDYEDAMVNSSLGNPGGLGNPGAVTKSYSGTAITPATSHIHKSSSDNERSKPFNNSTFSEADSENEFYDHETSTAGNGSSALNKIQDELKGLRNIMEAPLMQFAWGETGRVQPMYAKLLTQLMTLGLSSSISQSIAKRMSNQGMGKNSWIESLQLLANLVPTNNEDILSDGGIVALIGPTGVGKTTTIAKLAARFALKHGRRGVTLITTDNYRIGAHEQLRTYGRILGVPVHVASDAEELSAILKESKEKTQSSAHNLTLIDTAGLCQRDARLADQLATLNIDDVKIRNYLVLTATGQFNLQDDVIRAFSQIKLDGCILTKIDEASSLGEAMSVLIQHKLPVHYVCNGQKVPDDLHQARGKLLVKEAVKLMRGTQQQPSAETLAYTFGGVVNNASI